MNLRMLQWIGMLGGGFLIFFASAEFLRTYHAGEPKWKYIVLIFGMALILTLGFFRKRK